MRIPLMQYASPINPKTRTKPIHNGEVTHHHDQFATIPIPANFRNKKIKKIKPPRLIPFDVDSFDIFKFNLSLYPERDSNSYAKGRFRLKEVCLPFHHLGNLKK